MSDQEIVNRLYRELVYLLLTPADAFAAERNRRFRRLLEHHVRNARNTARSDRSPYSDSACDSHSQERQRQGAFDHLEGILVLH